jgi:ATP dependent DNA ligase domain
LVARGQARRLSGAGFQGWQGGAADSRNQKAFNCPQLLDALKSLPADNAILDGEIVALDEKSRSSFQLLQVFKSSEQRVPLVYYVFDLLFLDGKDIRKEPLSARRKLLAEVLKKAAEAENTSGPCWSATMLRMGSCSPAESEPDFPRNSWRASMHDCKSSGEPPARH